MLIFELTWVKLETRSCASSGRGTWHLPWRTAPRNASTALLVGSRTLWCSPTELLPPATQTLTHVSPRSLYTSTQTEPRCTERKKSKKRLQFSKCIFCKLNLGKFIVACTIPNLLNEKRGHELKWAGARLVILLNCSLHKGPAAGAERKTNKKAFCGIQ